MKFFKTDLKGVFLIESEPYYDERGYFYRSFCLNQFKKEVKLSRLVQSNFSFNYKKGTIRGMHYQEQPFEEEKIVHCIQGAIFDVVVDLRKESSTYLKWQYFELNDKKKLLYIPKGCAHGFQTLEDSTLICYQMSQFYCSEKSKGIRWNDVFFNIKWPLPVSIISEKDRSYQDFNRM